MKTSVHYLVIFDQILMKLSPKCKAKKLGKPYKLFTMHLWKFLLIFKLIGKGHTIGITHVFSCINICRVPRMLFEHEADRPSVQHHPRDPASVNAMKQTCVIVILAYFTLFQLNLH